MATASSAPTAHPIPQDRIEAIGDQLRAKIASKFTASTFFAGFALAVLASQASVVWNGAPPQYGCLSVSVGMVFAALVLFVRAVVALDALTMPKRFWPQGSTTSPSSPDYFLTHDDLWLLHDQMGFLWTRLTLAAAGLTGVAMVAMLIPIALPGTPDGAWTTCGAAVVGTLFGTGYAWHVMETVVARYGPLVRGD